MTPENRTRIIAADMPILTARHPVEPLLEAFRKLAAEEDDVRLVLTGRRHPEEIYCVWNFLDRHALLERVDFLPHYRGCREFPHLKRDCDVWISRHTPPSVLTADYLRARLAGSPAPQPPTALFFTCFQPEKQEGNSVLMRLWLEHLRAAGYQVHVVYYMVDERVVTAEMRRTSQHKYDLYREIPVRSRLTGANYNGLNVHVDDWCGPEVLETIAELSSRYEYDVAIVNYAFMSAVFDEVAAYTRKILLTHDRFADRNRKMLAQGYPESGWMSLDQRGERAACARADVVVALQEEEAEYFRGLVAEPERVAVVGTLFPRRTPPAPPRGSALRIGYFGSSNWVNEMNLGEFLKRWARDEQLRAGSEIVVGGRICETLKDFVPHSLLGQVAPRLLGPLDDLAELFGQCDLVINPDRGGTGIKIKTLETLAAGVPLLTTQAGAVGIGSESRFHAAEGFDELVDLARELLERGELLDELRAQSAELYGAYALRQESSLRELLDPGRAAAAPPPAEPPAAPTHLASLAARMVVPDYVRATCNDYHLEHFQKLLERVDLRGKRVLEIGSDYHLASSRLFLANGARSVVAVNMGNWRSDEPLPAGLEFRVGKIEDVDLPAGSFDIVYGLAVLEHFPQLRETCQAIRRVLAPDGMTYLQGCPLWPGTLGHHLWCHTQPEEGESVFYSFTDNNPIPDWAHLTREPAQLADLLVDQGLPRSDADAIVHQVYNLDGNPSGTNSNRLAASQVLAELDEHFELEVERTVSKGSGNEHFERALERYEEQDLRTLGIEIWARPKRAAVAPGPASSQPLVSIVIPFYGVEEFLGECLESVAAQEYGELEVLLVDDASPDGSRRIAQDYCERDPRFKLLTHDENQGLGPARNTGAARASGDWLLFLDSDDLFSSPQAVASLVEQARSTGARLVIGSCQQLTPEGRLQDYDREFDRSRGGRPGQFVSGRDAYLGASFIPGGQYVPMRAWGTLIDRILYQSSGLSFPASAHEDLPHTPFLYAFAEQVLYIPEIVVTYRQRASSISNSQWNGAMLGRYLEMWQLLRSNVERFDLQAFAGDTAVKTAEHLIMKLRQNGLARGCEQAAIDTLAAILGDARGELNEELFFYTMDSLHSVLSLKRYDYDCFHQLLGQVDARSLTRYYRRRLQGDFRDHGDLPLADPGEVRGDAGVVTAAGAAAPPTTARSTAQALAHNEALMEELLRQYRAGIGDALAGLPTMLTEGDQAVYFHAGQRFGFRGAIVDAGCFVGSTTLCLVKGLLANPLFEERRAQADGLIRVYDLFAIDDDYILEHLRQGYPELDFAGRDSFLELFEENLAPHRRLLDVRPGDVVQSGYADEEDIEVLGVDICKALPVTDFVVRNFFPRLVKGALVIQQDFIHQYHPHIHLSMLLLEDCFEPFLEIRWGGSVVYRCVRPITAELILERFGPDDSWYRNVAGNARLLRGLERRMLYSENRWILLLTLGIYHWSVGEHERAREIYREARKRFPEYTPHEVTTELIGGRGA